ncbi:MAG: hypothetical protein EPN74_15625 [Rhodanobacter sp.]|nr:MAG: hypothetical protein EPN74_15625 [Rhodanobacter sp.]
MTIADPFALARSRESFTLPEAARIATDIPLHRPYPKLQDCTPEQREEKGRIDEAAAALKADAEKLGVSVTKHPAVRERTENFVTRKIGSRQVSAASIEYGDVSKTALKAWCDKRGLRPAFFYPAGAMVIAPTEASSRALANLGDLSAELRAALEAHNAVYGDLTALAKKSPRQALAAWLSEHKPELSRKARERVATVANWQPAGGAPKTPAGQT